MAASALAGCGSKQAAAPAESKAAEEKTETVQEATEEAETAEGEETLTVWCWDPTFNVYAMKQAEALYQKDHPNFKLDIQEKVYTDIEQSLITAAEAGNYDTLPDILPASADAAIAAVNNTPTNFFFIPVPPCKGSITC